MKRAFRQPVWLFGAITWRADFRPALTACLEGLEGVTLKASAEHAVFFAPFADGASARQGWSELVEGQAWKKSSCGVLGQPLMHVLPRTGAWESTPSGEWFGEFTVDATIRTRADRSGGKRPAMRLPDLSGLDRGPATQVWPVLGHPGRLIVSGPDEEGVHAVGRAWAPAGFPSAENAQVAGRTLVEEPWVVGVVP